MKRLLSILFWLAVAAAGGYAYVTLTTWRGEGLNSMYILIAAICTYAIGYRFYSKWIAAQVLALDERRATPCVVNDDGHDFVKTNKWIVFGHHFAAISGPGPLVGPVLASQFGYLPGALWILIGVVLGGAVQDFVILFCSMRRGGKSLGQMVKEELNPFAGTLALVAILAIMVILLAVLALVVVKALAESPWGLFTVGATIPIAMLMGGYMRFWRVGRVMEASLIGGALLVFAVWGGRYVHAHEGLAKAFTLSPMDLSWMMIVYGVMASTLPVWLLLAPRDYLSTFLKLGAIFALVAGVLIVRPDFKMAAITPAIHGTGLVFAGKLFPFCFITIACGAVSGFHSLISSGTTPKIITREPHARAIGYGAMCLESLVAIMALIAACSLDPGVYLSMNVSSNQPSAAAREADTIRRIEAAGYVASTDDMHRLADQVKEKTLFGRTGGAATLAVGMTEIFSKVASGRWADVWYHFAIMFEAVFILTTIDAGTRVGRYLVQDLLGMVWKPLAHIRNPRTNLFASVLLVGSWGYFLIQGVRDPLGGINSLWPLFGIANQLLAGIALCLATTVILKMQLGEGSGARKKGRPAYALITLMPLAWILTTTMTAGWEKIFSPDINIGFLSKATALDEKLPILKSALASAPAGAVDAARKALSENRMVHFNNMLDAVVAGFFLIMVMAIALISVREWVLLMLRRRPAVTRESGPVWLRDSELAEARPAEAVGVLLLGFALIKEVSGQGQIDRAQATCVCCDHSGAVAEKATQAKDAYLKVTEERFNGINRCC